MNLDLLRELIAIFEESDLNEIEVEEDGQRMRIQKAPPMLAQPTALPLAPVVQEIAGDSAPDEPEPDPLSNYDTIDSPMVGTFYSAPSPGDPAFVNIGDKIDKDTTVCIVEAMKLMNEVAAKTPCIVEKILVDNGDPVEFGQPLFAVSPR